MWEVHNPQGGLHDPWGGCVTLGVGARPLGRLHNPWGGCRSPEQDTRPQGGDSQPQGPPLFLQPPTHRRYPQAWRCSGSAAAARGHPGLRLSAARLWDETAVSGLLLRLGGAGGVRGGSVCPIPAPTQLRLPFPALFGGAEPPLAVAHGAGAGGVAGLREEAQRLHLLQGGRVSSARTRERPPFLGGIQRKIKHFPGGSPPTRSRG